jgi:hypothetical protein
MNDIQKASLRKQVLPSILMQNVIGFQKTIQDSPKATIISRWGA